MSVEQAEHEIGVFLAQFPFDVYPKVFDWLEADRSASPPRATAASLATSAEQEVAMLADFVRRMGPILARRADEVRTRPVLVLDARHSDDLQRDLSGHGGLAPTSWRPVQCRSRV